MGKFYIPLMNILSAIVLSGFLEVGAWNGGVVQYERPDYFEASFFEYPIYTEMDINATLKPFTIESSIRCDMYMNGLTTYEPFQNTYTIGARFDFGNMRMGYSHTCFHPMQAYAFVRDTIMPRFEGYTNNIYIRFSF